jgi:hypothetical protein
MLVAFRNCGHGIWLLLFGVEESQSNLANNILR